MNVNFKSSVEQGKSLFFGKSNDNKKTLFKKAPPMPTWDIGIRTDIANQTFGIQLNGISPNITVDWGDGTIETFTTTGNKVKIYSTAGNYTVKLSGNFSANGNIRLNNGQDNVKSVSVIPFISGLTSFGFCFNGCTTLTSIPIGFFANNTAVTDFSACFRNCLNLTSIPTGLFDNNTAVTNFSRCFETCTNLSNVPAGLFANNTAVTNFSTCFIGVTLTTESYSNLLINMALNATSRQNNVPFHGGNSKYNLNGQTAKEILETKGWTFTDLGLE